MPDLFVSLSESITVCGRLLTQFIGRDSNGSAPIITDVSSISKAGNVDALCGGLKSLFDTFELSDSEKKALTEWKKSEAKKKKSKEEGKAPKQSDDIMRSRAQGNDLEKSQDLKRAEEKLQTRAEVLSNISLYLGPQITSAQISESDISGRESEYQESITENRNVSCFLPSLLEHPSILTLFAQELNKVKLTHMPSLGVFKSKDTKVINNNTRALSLKFRFFCDLRHMRDKQGVRRFNEACQLESASGGRKFLLDKVLSFTTRSVFGATATLSFLQPFKQVIDKVRVAVSGTDEAHDGGTGVGTEDADVAALKKIVAEQIKILEKTRDASNSTCGVFKYRDISTAKFSALNNLLEEGLKNTTTYETQLNALQNWKTTSVENSSIRGTVTTITNEKLATQCRSRFFSDRPATSHDALFKLEMALRSLAEYEKLSTKPAVVSNI